MFRLWPKRQIKIRCGNWATTHKHTNIGVMKNLVLSLISPLLFLYRQLYYPFIHEIKTYYNFCNFFQKFEYNLIINQNNLCTKKKLTITSIKEPWLKVSSKTLHEYYYII